MTVRRVFKKGALYIDGENYAGQVKSFTPPKWAENNNELSPMSGVAPEDVWTGTLEKLEAAWTMLSFDREVLALLGMRVGARLPLTYRSAIQSPDGTVEAHHMFFRGKITEAEIPEMSAGSEVHPSYKMHCTYFRYEIDGTTVLKVDLDNRIIEVDGVNLVGEINRAMGL